ncbi:MAG: YbaK/EbsC family protein [Clostridiales bacterium]|nr:YbaK/EbsC family protein [Clostridiales bacterium]
MAIEIVREYLKKWNAQDRVLEFPVSSATVELAAQAVGCEPARIAKTLSFLVPDAVGDKDLAAQGGAHAVLIVAAGDAKVDNSKYKQYFHTKAKMLHGEQVTELIGHAIGGVCPFGVKDGVEIFLDVSLKRFDTVFPAAGSSNSAIEVTMEELERFSGSSTWIDVCKGWQEE